MSTFAARLGFEFRLPRPPVMLLLVLIDTAAFGVDVVTGVIMTGVRATWWQIFGYLLVPLGASGIVLGLLWIALLIQAWRLGIDSKTPSRDEWRRAVWTWVGTLWMLLLAVSLARA